VPESARNSTCRRLPILHNHAQLAQVRVGNHEPDDVYPVPIRWTAESVRSSGMLPRQVRRRSRSVLPPGRWAQRPGVSSPNYRDYRALSPATIGHGLGCFHAGIAMKSTNVIESSWRCEGQSKRVALGPLGSRPSLLLIKGAVVYPIVFTYPARIANLGQIIFGVPDDKIGVRSGYSGFQAR